jgi:hypothetical protein
MTSNLKSWYNRVAFCGICPRLGFCLTCLAGVKDAEKLEDEVVTGRTPERQTQREIAELMKEIKETQLELVNSKPGGIQQELVPFFVLLLHQLFGSKPTE